MKHLLLTTISALLVVGCGESQQSTPLPETTPVEPVRQFGVDVGMIVPVAEAAKIGPPTAKESIHRAAETGNIEAVKQHLAAGADVNAGRSDGGGTPLHFAAGWGQKEMVELLIAKGAEVNARTNNGGTPLGLAIWIKETEIADLLRKHGGKTAEELKAEGK
jgi:ankyrin repeat protein